MARMWTNGSGTAIRMFFIEPLYSIRIFLCTALVVSCAFGAASQLPPDMHDLAMASIDAVYKEKFKLAEEEAKKLIKKYPDHPAGYFFYAAALESGMSYYETDKQEEEFYRYCDLTIDKAELCLKKNPGDDWAAFFLGGADGYKGTYESRYEKWITSFRHAWKGVSTLQTLYKKNPAIKDASYGLGMYDYWRSAMTKTLWWMPGIENKSAQGIKELLEAQASGVYTCIAASARLITIYNNEKRHNEALTLANGMLAQYSGTLVFLWGKAAALFGKEQFDESEKTYLSILEKVTADPIDNHYNSFLCHYWLAKIYQKQNRKAQCLAECQKMESYKLDETTGLRLSTYRADESKIKQSCGSLK